MMAEKKSLVLFHTELDTINLFSEQMKTGFERLGYDIYVLDTSDMIKGLGLLYEYQKSHNILAMIGFNSRFFGAKTPSGLNIWETLGIPSVNILLDHPFWYEELLHNTPQNGIVLCVDRNHMSFVNRFYPQIAMNGFLPHGGTVLGDRKSIAERKLDVVYAGSLYAFDAERAKGQLGKWPFDAQRICDNAIECLIADPKKTIEAELERQLLQHGIELANQELIRFISSTVYIERVVSSYYREKMVSRVAEAGVPLTIYGQGWEKCKWIRKSNAHYEGLIPAKEALRKVSECKLLLNSMPWFKDGSHERMFNGMLNGAVVVTDESKYFKECIPDDLYLSLNLQDDLMGEKVADLFSQKSRLQDVADAAYDFVKDSHTWEARATELHNDLLQYL